MSHIFLLVLCGLFSSCIGFRGFKYFLDFSQIESFFIMLNHCLWGKQEAQGFLFCHLSALTILNLFFYNYVQ